MGAALTGIPLKNFGVVGPSWGLASEFSVYVTTYDKGGHVKGEYCYLDEILAPGYLAPSAGWYTYESVSKYSPVSADEDTIAFNEGFMVQSDCGASLTFSGEVRQQKTSIYFDTTDGAFTCAGNCSPVDVKLEDIEVIGPEWGLASEFSVYITTYDEGGHLKGEYCYLDEILAPGYLAPCAGWYTYESVSKYSPQSAGKDVINSGEMFMIQTDCGATINIPSPIETPAAE